MNTVPDAPVYLDYNGTTPVAPEVAEAMWPFLTKHFGNPSSATPQGRTARQAVTFAREQVAALIGAHPEEVIFTSGGTEANNLAIRGAADSASTQVVVTSAVEHPATAEPVARLEAQGWRAHRMGVDVDGRIDPSQVPAGQIGLGTLILAQNEVGTLQPVTEFAEYLHNVGGVVHADAAQAVGKIPLAVDALGVDLLSIAGHKLYAPKGVGALYIRRGTQISPVLVGAGQERGVRPGTENVAGVVGLGMAAELAAAGLATEPERQRILKELLWSELSSAIPGLARISPVDDCLPNTLMVAVPERIGQEILGRAEAVSASTGSACHAGVHAPAQTLLAMDIDPELALGALRLSLGRGTVEADIHAAVSALAEAAQS